MNFKFKDNYEGSNGVKTQILELREQRVLPKSNESWASQFGDAVVDARYYILKRTTKIKLKLALTVFLLGHQALLLCLALGRKKRAQLERHQNCMEK
jgi:hypothetical protein